MKIHSLRRFHCAWFLNAMGIISCSLPPVLRISMTKVKGWSLNIYSQLHIFKWFQYFSRWRWCSFDLVTEWPWIRCDFGWSTTYAGTIIVSKHEYNRTINWTYTYPGIVFCRFGWRSRSSLSVGKGRARIGAIAAVTRMNKRDSLIWTMLNK